jgi:hypothetical protein
MTEDELTRAANMLEYIKALRGIAPADQLVLAAKHQLSGGCFAVVQLGTKDAERIVQELLRAHTEALAAMGVVLA